MATLSRLDYDSPGMGQGGHRTRDPVVPAERLLQLLGITAADLDGGTVEVSTSGLRRLLTEFARHQPFNPQYYGEMNPDIEAARLAGQVPNLHDHFVRTGFLEGRLPTQPPFDPLWYVTFYTDLAAVIPAENIEELRNHFLSAGLIEGRAGTEASLRAPHPLFKEED